MFYLTVPGLVLISSAPNVRFFIFVFARKNYRFITRIQRQKFNRPASEAAT